MNRGRRVDNNRHNRVEGGKKSWFLKKEELRSLDHFLNVAKTAHKRSKISKRDHQKAQCSIFLKLDLLSCT